MANSSIDRRGSGTRFVLETGMDASERLNWSLATRQALNVLSALGLFILTLESVLLGVRQRRKKFSLVGPRLHPSPFARVGSFIQIN